jgi:hypothetical protein
MPIKPTIRKDGHRRFTIREDFHVGPEALILAAAELLNYDKPVTKASIERRVRLQIWSMGMSWVDYGHERLAGDWDALSASAATLVGSLWPEYAGEVG